MKKIAMIGSTGSIGRQTLNVVKANPDKFKIVTMSAGNNQTLFLEQVKEFKPKIASLVNKTDCADDFKETKFVFGENAFTECITEEVDLVVVALVGFKGIIAVLSAIEKGKNIALANKESLVVGGELVTKLARDKGLKITPIDSEHSAIWQALNFDFTTPFHRLILTASGGAFRDYTKEQLENATKDDALKHPNWAMGAKITVDCATLVNKGFEVIEAKWLYNAPFEKIDVIIHRESIIHSMVEFNDGSIMAQMSYPTMELPIQLAMNYPERLTRRVESLDFAKLKNLTFENPDFDRFPCLPLVIESGKKGGLYPAMVNGANEEAVKLFLQDKIKYNDIYKSLKMAFDKTPSGKADSFESVKEADAYARRIVKEMFGE